VPNPDELIMPVEEEPTGDPSHPGWTPPPGNTITVPTRPGGDLDGPPEDGDG